MGDEAPWRDRAADGEDLIAGSEEIDVEGEAHAEGVDGGAAWDQQPRPGVTGVEQRQTEEPGAEADRDRDFVIGDHGAWG